MNLLPFQIREYFHLLILKELNKKLATRIFALKGGVFLRLFLLSPRLSEDMDLDVDPKIQVSTLGKIINTMLNTPYIYILLQQYGITNITFSSPKQTPTVQRWKIALYQDASHFISTKLEFSKRKSDINTVIAIPSSHILQSYSIVPFSCKVYAVEDIFKQKVCALASESRFAVRDLFDINHIIQSPLFNKQKAVAIKPHVKSEAIKKINHFSFNDFKNQVIPFLNQELIEYYTNKDNFYNLIKNVNDFIGTL